MGRTFSYDKYNKGDNLVFRLLIPPRDIGYFSGTIEAYDGVGLVRTVDPRRAVVEAMVPGDQRETFERILGFLEKQISIEVIARP
jgi:hypothetical protein